MNPYVVAAIYGLVGGFLGNLLAAVMAVTVRRQVKAETLGTALGVSGGFILGVAFLDLIAEARANGHNDFVVALGIALGTLLMVGLGALLKALGVGEEEEEDSHPAKGETDVSVGIRSARLIAIGEGIHNIPEALPIGAALVVSPHLGLLVALLMTVENFVESGAIAGELVRAQAGTGQIYWLTIWPGLLSVVGAPIGVLLAGISPLLLALTLALAAGIMLFIGGEVWCDGRELAGVGWSSVGLVAGVPLALATAGVGPG